MTTSSNYIFNPTFANLLDEAMERAGIDPADITSRHIISAKMSINLMLTEWAVADGDAIYRNASATTTVNAGTNNFPVDTVGALDIIGNDMVSQYGSDTTEIPIARISREDYLRIAVKTQAGRATQFYVDQDVVLNTPTVYLWPVPDQTTIFRYDYMRAVQTVGQLSETIDVQRLWLAAVAAGLARRLALKFNPSKLPVLIPEEKESYALARRAGSGNSQVTLSVRGFGNSSRQRRW